MRSLLDLDEETTVPLSLIDACPFNPKKELRGVYREGLAGSLDYYGVRDRLKVTPYPGRPGRYMAINGNRRVALIREAEVNRLVAEHFNLESPKPAEIDRLRNSPENEPLLEEIARRVDSSEVPVQILTRVNAEKEFDEEECKLFVMTWDRNKGVHDEAKQSELFMDLVKNRDVALLRKLTHPEELKAAVSSPPPDPTAYTPIPVAAPSESPVVEHTPTAEDPFGPPPPEVDTPPPPPSLIPFGPLALTPEGYKDISERILRSKSRIFREQRLKEALGKLEKISMEAVDELDSVVVELALRILNVHVEVAEARPEKTWEV